MLKYSLLSVGISKCYENICIKEVLTIYKSRHFYKNVNYSTWWFYSAYISIKVVFTFV